MNKPHITTHILETPEDFKALQQYVKENNFEVMAIDVETDGIQEKKAKIYGIGLCFTPGEGFYIPIRKPDGSLQWSSLLVKFIVRWIVSQAQEKKLIAHNGIFDVLCFENNFGFDLTPNLYSDTILLKHALDEEQPFGLKETSVKYLGEWADQAQDDLKENVLSKGGKWLKEDKQMYLADTAILGKYCAWDVVLTRYLFDLFEPKLKEQELDKLFYEEEIMPLYRTVTIPMKRAGFTIDVAHFEKLRADIKKEIEQVEDEVQDAISELTWTRCMETLHEVAPVRNSGKFAQTWAEMQGIPLPINAKTQKVTLAAKAIQTIANIYPEHLNFYTWLLNDGLDNPFPNSDEVRLKLFFDKYPDQRHVFNLSSNDDLKWLFFTKLGFEPLSKTEGGAPQCDDDFLESIKTECAFVDKLLEYKRLNKLLSTYIEGILDRQHEGVLYSSMLQFGTTSGRYSSRSPNLQNLPRVKDEESNISPLVLKYANEIKKGFIAPEGYVLVNADYESLEPRGFAHVSGDKLLQDVFHKNLDLYSQVAIHTWNMEGVSADKKADNYLGKVSKETRQKAKVFALACVYGAEPNRIAQLMGISWQEAQEILSNYLDAFPELKKYMSRQDYEAKTKGFVRTQFGRVRHLHECQGIYKRYSNHIMNYRWAAENGVTDKRRLFKNCLNNAKNFPIQGIAAHVVNRAMLAIAHRFREEGIDACIIMQVHDEITTLAKKEQAERVRLIMKECMENTVKLSVPLKADPVVALNWADAK